MWKTVEASGGKIGMGKTERRGSKRRSREEERRKGLEKKTEKGEDGGSKEDSRGVGNLGRRRGGGKIRGRGKKVSAREISQMDKSVWKEAIREDANKQGVGPRDRCEESVCAEKGEGVPIVKEGKGGGKREQLRKGYIWPSKSLQMAPVFFVGKKNGKK